MTGINSKDGRRRCPEISSGDATLISRTSWYNTKWPRLIGQTSTEARERLGKPNTRSPTTSTDRCQAFGEQKFISEILATSDI